MKTRRIVIFVTALTLCLGLFAGHAAAAGYSRYILPTPDGGKAYIFTTPGRPGLGLLLRDIYGDGFPWEMILRRFETRPAAPGGTPQLIDGSAGQTVQAGSSGSADEADPSHPAPAR